MQVYLKSRGCPKCGGKDTYDEYRAAGRHPLDTKPERISRQCARCAARWDEAPLDAKDGA